MSGNIISSSDAYLLLHRLVTERIPVVAWFVSADGSMRAKLTGVISSSAQPEGLRIVSWLTPLQGEPIQAWMRFKEAACSVYQYSDESEVPADIDFGSGLCLTMPNGDRLTIAEIRNHNT